MVRVLACLFVILVFGAPVVAQTRHVDPDDLKLELLVEELPATPFRQEMILLTIHGVYKRHITRETLIQPDFAGFSWMQLGQDYWYESMISGLPVKNMRRRVAIFADEVGTLEIGSFQHKLTLLDEQNKWFDHTIKSDPVSIKVMQEPSRDEWWFPVRGLKVSDDWSNAPDQLKEGEGVLRVVRVSALGASPDMLPPMPELRSPSALIFAHPEKRLVDLTPNGPQAIAFWRWTVTPTNGHAAILEPIEFTYFDTLTREDRTVEISAQRVAFGETVIPEATTPTPPIVQARLWSGTQLTVGVFAFLAALMLMLQGRAVSFAPFHGWLSKQRMLARLRKAARVRDDRVLRRTAHELDALYQPDADRQAMLHGLDTMLFGKSRDTANMVQFARDFQNALRTPTPPKTPRLGKSAAK
ncbi:MAG: hypothetical protein AAFW87_02885 [Pseudomonadota bacterium]